jgi:hypothetical protein
MNWNPDTTTKTVTASFSGKKSYDDVQLMIDFVRLAEIDWAFVEFLPVNERFAEPNKIELEDGDYLVKYSFSGKAFETIMHVAAGRLTASVDPEHGCQKTTIRAD